MILQGDSLVSGGDVVLVIGYPDGLLDSNNYMPLLRDARISTPFGLAFQDQPKFITDALMYPGMSGSPIVAGPRTLKNPATGGLRTSSQGFGLLGIHSDNYQRPNGEQMERLNLNAGWYAKIINTTIVNYLRMVKKDNEEEILERISQAHPDALNLDPGIIESLIRTGQPDR